MKSRLHVANDSDFESKVLEAVNAGVDWKLVCMNRFRIFIELVMDLLIV